MNYHDWFDVVHNDERWRLLALDYKDAATGWAETYESECDDFDISEGREKARVKVRKVDEKEWKNFVVTGEIVTNYTAEEIEDNDESNN